MRTSEKIEPETTMERNEEKSHNATGQSTKDSSFDFNVVAAALDSQNVNVPLRGNNSLQDLAPEHPKLGVFSHAVGKKEKLNKIVGFSNGKYHLASDLRAGANNVVKVAESCVVDKTLAGEEAFRNASQNDGSRNIIHFGVACDGCDMHPIIGPRFKSKVQVNYDLCRICFEVMGNSNDYIRMDWPTVLPPLPFKGLCDAVHAARARNQSPMCPHVYEHSKVIAKLDSRLIQDVNIFDGSVMAPSTPFTKMWKMRNNGRLIWPPKTQLVWVGGDKLSNALSVEVQIPPAGLRIDQELDIAVDFISPELPGRYGSYWRMALPSGYEFGQRVWVDASVKETPRETLRN